jgi:hypothetical protein
MNHAERAEIASPALSIQFGWMIQRIVTHPWKIMNMFYPCRLQYLS